MLRKVLEAVQRSDGGTDLRSLSRELGIEPSALEGMIEFWVLKGQLVDERSAARCSDQPKSTCASCRAGCYGATVCPRVVSAPPSASDRD
ncbi:MAG: FeoC-like transcriptional regulator [Anaerolineae bacterium]